MRDVHVRGVHEAYAWEGMCVRDVHVRDVHVRMCISGVYMCVHVREVHVKGVHGWVCMLRVWI